MGDVALSDLLSPAAFVAALAERGIPISERELRLRARKLKACREIGKAMFFTPADVQRIIAEALTKGTRECQTSTDAMGSGITLSPSVDDAYERVLRRLSKAKPKPSPKSTTRANVVPLSSARKRS
jgi:hypothetical protein